MVSSDRLLDAVNKEKKRLDAKDIMTADQSDHGVKRAMPDSTASSVKKSKKESRFDAKDLIMVRGKYYDLRIFAHPGGDLVIRQSMGTDATVSVASHHFTDAPYRAMKNYEVDASSVNGSIRQAQYSFHKDGFFETLKRRVAAEVGPGASGVRQQPSMWYNIKVATSILVWFMTWVYCCTCSFWWPPVMVCCALRLVLVGIGHESIHGRIPGLRHVFHMMLLLPADHWHLEHCLQHHPDCKRLDFDPDETFPALRMNEGTPWSPHHVVQVILEFVLSVFTGIAMWVDNHLIKGKQVLISTFLIFTTQLAPMFLHPDGFYAGLYVHFAVVGISNVVTIQAFHLSHINKHNTYQFKEGVDWGEHQLRTTSNWVASWYSVTGMLEMQIEHHLFPSLTYEVQEQIKPLVKKTAAEFQIPYFEFPSIFHGMAAHLGFLHELGNWRGKCSTA